MDKKADLEAIKVRIAKLKKHAASALALGSKEEAEAFTMKANALLLEYNLLESDINMEEGGDKFKKWAYSEELNFKCNQSGQRAKLKLASILCDHNMCSYYTNYDFTFQVYGNMENVDMVVWLYNYLSVGLLRLAQEHHVKLSPEMKKVYNRYAYLKDFLLGAAIGIDRQLVKQKAQMQHAAGIYAMIKVNKDDLIQYAEKNLNLKPGRKSKPVQVGFGYQQGIAAGENYKINNPLGDAPTKAAIDNTKRLNY